MAALPVIDNAPWKTTNPVPTGIAAAGVAPQSNADFLQSQYAGIGRTNIDKEGMDYWTNQLNNGASRDSVASAIQTAAKDPNTIAKAASIDQGYAAAKGLVSAATPAAPVASPTISPAYNAPARPADSTPRTIADNETVAGQINGILGDNSKYIQAARARGAEEANARGGLIGTMGAQAGEKAAIDAALPIATSDANTYATSANEAQLANQDITKLGYQGDLSSAISRQEAGQAQALASMNAQNTANLQASKAASDLTQATTIANINAASGLTQATTIANINAANQLKLQNVTDAAAADRQLSQLASNKEIQQMNIDQQIATNTANLSSSQKVNYTNQLSTLFQQLQTYNNSIINLPDSQMDAASKDAAVAKNQAWFANAVSALGSVVNNKAYDWTPVSAPLSPVAPVSPSNSAPPAAPSTNALTASEKSAGMTQQEKAAGWRVVGGVKFPPMGSVDLG